MLPKEIFQKILYWGRWKIGINICELRGRTATILCLAAAGWISVIVWARICLREQSKYLRDLGLEIDFFDTEGGYEQGGQ